MTEVWIGNPRAYIIEALDEGFTRFSWHAGHMKMNGTEALSWFRTATMGYSRKCRFLLVDHYGAAEYSPFTPYDKPIAVYPSWTPEESWDNLIWLMENNPGEDENYYDDDTVAPAMRVVKGQAHRVVIHRIGSGGIDQQTLLLQLRDLQLRYPKVDMFISGVRQHTYVLGYGFGSADWCPSNVTPTGGTTRQILLPSGKVVGYPGCFSPRYDDWYALVGWSSSDLIEGRDFLRYNLRAFAWAAVNWNRVVPFATVYNGKKNFLPEGTITMPDSVMKLPAARRRLMRNLGPIAGELDQFQCDTCILQNACTLYRAGSVCIVKGSETVGLAENFGSRSSSVIINALGELMKRQVSRLEEAEEAEEASGELDPEVTKMYKSIFSQGVTLAKLVDPELNKGTQVNVNVGVATGTTAQQVAQADPRQLVAGIVRELEAQGIPREEITSDMIKGVLSSAAQNGGTKVAVQAISAQRDDRTAHRRGTRAEDPKIIQGELK
jgi:hypothetical protein